MSTFVPRPTSPCIKATRLVHLRHARRDVARAERYYLDFGLHVAARTGSAVYLRGALPHEPCVILESGPHDAFESFALAAASEDDLARVARASGSRVERRNEPGGGLVVRLADPSGFPVEVVHGIEPLAALPLRSPAPANLPLEKRRVNAPWPALLGPAQVGRLGHVVLGRQEFARNARFYMDTFGLLASDVEVADGEPLVAFLRFDHGESPSDHHSVVIASAPEDGYLHAAFETLDASAIGEGAEWLQHRGWVKSWGIGRHVLGSQIFCYHFDPSGFEVEHYADGDVFDASVPTRYHPAGLSGLYLWGQEIPPHFVDTGMTPSRVARIARGLVARGEFTLSRLLAARRAYSERPRPWIGRPFQRPRPD